MSGVGCDTAAIVPSNYPKHLTGFIEHQQVEADSICCDVTVMTPYLILHLLRWSNPYSIQVKRTDPSLLYVGTCGSVCSAALFTQISLHLGHYFM